MIEVNRLTKSYASIPAVNGVTFTIQPGQVLGYLGPNGSGKSTTVKILTGLMAPTSGEVRFNGEDIRKDPAGYKSRLGYVPEESNLYPYLSGGEYLQMVGTLRGIESSVLEKKINDILDLFSLSGHKYSPLLSYSKGMRQRILISAALLHDPEILIFDEPLSGLDVTSAAIFRHLVQRLAAEGKHILYSSHVLEVVEKVCSHALILNKGNCVAYNSVERLRDDLALGTLEKSFAHFVNEPDTEAIARDVVAVMRLR